MKHRNTVLAYALGVENPKCEPVSNRKIATCLSPFVSADEPPTVIRKIRRGEIAVSSRTHSFRSIHFG